MGNASITCGGRELTQERVAACHDQGKAGLRKDRHKQVIKHTNISGDQPIGDKRCMPGVDRTKLGYTEKRFGLNVSQKYLLDEVHFN